jgi:hypothetical protein
MLIKTYLLNHEQIRRDSVPVCFGREKIPWIYCNVVNF